RHAMNAQILSYFARQTAVPEIGQAGLERLQSAKVALVGTGGVGSAAAYFLASQGIGFLKLIDQDVVEESNLHRLIGVGYQDLHLPKAEALSRKLSSRHPWTRTESMESCETAGVTPTIVGLVGSLAATEAAKRILGLRTAILGQLLTVDLAGPDFLFTKIAKREECPVCSGSLSEIIHRDNAI